MKIIWLFALFLSIATPLHAEAKWLEASSDHFVVYSDQNEKDVRKYTDRLERYHNAMALQFPQLQNKPSASNRVTVYVVRDVGQVQKLAGDKNGEIAGFYLPRAGSSSAFVPRIGFDDENDDFSQVVLRHEYAHHVMFSISSYSYPLWFTEGFAEFYAAAKFNDDGSVGLGLPAKHRFAELFLAKDVPVESLLDTARYLKNKTKTYDAFYGRSWLLFHYLRFDEKRKGQMSAYLAKLTKGEKELDAAKTVFGDLKTLDNDMDRYMLQRRLSYNLLSGDTLKPGAIAIRMLGPGASAMMSVRIQSKRGVDEKAAALLLPAAKAVAAQYPDDPFVLTALSEAEYDAGHDAEAIAAADKSTAIDKGQTNAYLQKGYAMARMAKDAKNPDAAWSKVRKQFLIVNGIENDHPIPLIQFYESYIEQGKKPTENAVTGLEWALQLSPFDVELRLTVAQQMIGDERYDDAITVLGPLASSPHNKGVSDSALEMIKKAEEARAKQAADAKEGANNKNG